MTVRNVQQRILNRRGLAPGALPSPRVRDGHRCAPTPRPVGTKRQLRIRVRILVVSGICGAFAAGIGLWLLMIPIRYVDGESCGSVLTPSLPAGDDSAVSSCLNLRSSYSTLAGP